MGKVIRRICKHDQRKWPYSFSKNTFILTQWSKNYIQNQPNSASDASTGAHVLASSVPDQSTSHDIKLTSTIVITHSHLKYPVKIIAVLLVLAKQSPYNFTKLIHTHYTWKRVSMFSNIRKKIRVVKCAK